MWLKSARLRNVGPHADLSVALERGLVALTGPNGSGKSSFLSAVLANLANDWSRFHGGKTGAINDTAGEDEPADLTCTYEHDGVAFTVTRGLRPPSHELVVPSSGLKLSRDGEIRAHLEALLGVDGYALSGCVFVRQRAMAGWLQESPGKRAEAFHRFCGTGLASEVFEAAGRVAAEQAADAGAVDAVDDLVRDLAGTRVELDRLTAEAQRLEYYVLAPDDVRKAEQTIADARLRVSLGEQLSEAYGRRDRADAEVDGYARAADAGRSAVAALRVEADALGPEADRAAEGLAAHAAADAADERFRKAEQARITRSGEDRPAPLEPPLRFPDLDLEGLRGAVHDARARLNRAKDTLAAFDKNGVAECPTCGTPAEHLAGHLEDCRFAVASEPARLAMLTAELNAREKYRRDLAEWQRWRAGYDARLAEAEARVAEARDALVPRPSSPAGLLAEAVRLGRDARSRLAAAERQLEKSEAAVRAARSARDAVDHALERLEERLAALTDTPKRVARAERYLKEHRDAVTALAGVDGRRSALGDKESDLARRLAKARKLARVAEGRGRAAGLLNRLRAEVTHHSKLPRLVARGNLETMEGELNRELDGFGGPFWVETGEDLGFLVHFPGAPPRPAEELSGGQQAVFSFAYRPVHARLFGADVGMLALDEPTDGLDATNLAYLRDALQRLAGTVRGRRQLIIVTHHESLLPAFDQVVRFGEGTGGAVS